MCVYVWGGVHGHLDVFVCMYTNVDKCDFSTTAWRKMHGFSSLKCWFDKREMRTFIIFASPIWSLHPKDGRTKREIEKLMGKLKESYSLFMSMFGLIFQPWPYGQRLPENTKQFVLIKRPCWAVCRWICLTEPWYNLADLADAPCLSNWTTGAELYPLVI